jgi:molybdopterin adenylyltransferase
MNPEHTKALPIRAGIITVSSSRDMSTDTSGKIISDALGASGIPVGYYVIIPDRVQEIRGAVIRGLSICNCIILNGGTGLTYDDCTIEAVESLYDKKIDGFGELFRMKSYEEIGTASMLSRASAGIVEHKVVFCIPGSNGAVRLAIQQLIVPEIAHILTHAGKKPERS